MRGLCPEMGVTDQALGLAPLEMISSLSGPRILLLAGSF